MLDANVYVAAYLSRNPRSPNKELFRRWRDSQFMLLVSKDTLEEVVEKFDELGIDQRLTFELVSHILADAEDVLSNLKEVSLAYLFGSRLEGR